MNSGRRSNWFRDAIGNQFFRVIVLLIIASVVVLLVCTPRKARATDIPSAADAWRMPLTAFAESEWGRDAPVSTFAAQIHQESAWKPNARSPVGALGLTQFMPTTASWISKLYPSELGDNDPSNPLWSLRALVKYDRWIQQRVRGRGWCDQIAAVLASYNQGIAWTYRAQKQFGTDQWLLGAELVNPGQSAAAFKESRAYPRRILGQLEPRYVVAGWGKGACS